MKEETFYLVREDVLPEAMRKTLEVKKLIERKKAESIAEAVQKVDLSRSAFYKYRDAVFPFYTMVKEQIITLFSFGRPFGHIVPPASGRRRIGLQRSVDSPDHPPTGKGECHIIRQYEGNGRKC